MRLTRTRPSSAVEGVLLDGTMGVYLGWVCIATVANTAAALVYRESTRSATPRGVWAVVVLVVAGGVGVVLALTGGGRLAPAIALAWGLAWVAVARTDEPTSTVVAITAAVAAAVTPRPCGGRPDARPAAVRLPERWSARTLKSRPGLVPTSDSV